MLLRKCSYIKYSSKGIKSTCFISWTCPNETFILMCSQCLLFLSPFSLYKVNIVSCFVMHMLIISRVVYVSPRIPAMALLLRFPENCCEVNYFKSMKWGEAKFEKWLNFDKTRYIFEHVAAAQQIFTIILMEKFISTVTRAPGNTVKYFNCNHKISNVSWLRM